MLTLFTQNQTLLINLYNFLIIWHILFQLDLNLLLLNLFITYSAYQFNIYYYFSSLSGNNGTSAPLLPLIV